MKEKFTSKWNYIEDNYCLLFFAQVVEELLFYYTIDSYRLPAHNIHSLVKEGLKTIQHINSDILKDGSLQPIIEEIIDHITSDHIISLIFDNNENEIITILNKSKSINEKNDILIFINKMLNQNYLKLLKKEIRSKISEGKRKELIQLSKALIIELNYTQYSKEYIYNQCMEIFFRQKVGSIDSYDVFINSFDNKIHKYNSIFKVGNGFSLVEPFLNSERFEVITKANSRFEENRQYNIDDYLNGNDSYIKILDVIAKDKYKAFYKSKYEIDGIKSHISFLRHDEELDISHEGIIYDSEIEDTVELYSEIKSPIFRRPDEIKEEDFIAKFNYIATCQNPDNIDKNSLQRLDLAFQRHSSALNSVSYESQLVDLWSGIEILLPVYTKENHSKISQLISSLIPILVDNYIDKILNDLWSSLKFSKKWDKIQKFLGKNDIETNAQLSQFLLTSEKAEMDELYNLLDRNILLIDRIMYLKSIFQTPRKILNRLQSHEKRVSWQIQRIYRARNLIIHAGKTPYQLETLIENLHYYFDTFISSIVKEISKSSDLNSIRDIVVSYTLKKEKYYNFLEKNKDERINSENIKSLLSISV